MATIVRGSILAAAAKCASTEPARPQLNGVFVSGDGTVAATNGHVLFEAKPCEPLGVGRALMEYPTARIGADLGAEFNGEGVIIPTAAAVAAAKNAKNKARNFPAICDRAVIVKRASGGETFSTDLDADKREGFRPIEGPFPKYQQLFPLPERTVLRIGLSLSALESIVSAFKAAGVDDGHGGQLVFSFTGPLTACTISASTRDLQAVRGLIMPLRLE